MRQRKERVTNHTPHTADTAAPLRSNNAHPHPPTQQTLTLCSGAEMFGSGCSAPYGCCPTPAGAATATAPAWPPAWPTPPNRPPPPREKPPAPAWPPAAEGAKLKGAEAAALGAEPKRPPPPAAGAPNAPARRGGCECRSVSSGCVQKGVRHLTPCPTANTPNVTHLSRHQRVRVWAPGRSSQTGRHQWLQRLACWLRQTATL